MAKFTPAILCLALELDKICTLFLLPPDSPRQLNTLEQRQDLPALRFQHELFALQDLLAPDVPIISVSKGLELGTGKMMSEVIPQALGRRQPAAYLSGPSFAKEVMDLRPTGIVAASKVDLKKAGRFESAICGLIGPGRVSPGVSRSAGCLNGSSWRIRALAGGSCRSGSRSLRHAERLDDLNGRHGGF